jgi:hypothetical protein
MQGSCYRPVFVIGLRADRRETPGAGTAHPKRSLDSMALFRCNHCGALAEHERETVGTQIPCHRCGQAGPIYDTVFFVGKLLEQYFKQRDELIALRAAAPAPEAAPAVAVAGAFDIHNTDQLSNEAQHRDIVEWFRRKGITATINARAVDTSGFFDEAAVTVGNDYELLGEVFERIRYAQQKEYNGAVLYLDKKTPEDAKALEAFARKLHEYSLVARYIGNKEEKNVRLVLQNAPGVRRFFAGEWLEWFALMTGLRVCQDRQTNFSCARNLTLAFPPDEKRELDAFFLLNKTRPLYIECKTGEFRPDLDKYVALKKRLGIESRYFIVCVADLPTEQAKGLGAMYDMTFANTQTLGPHLASVI